MKALRGSSEPNNNSIRVGIYRDIETPEVDINSAVVGIDKLHEKFGRIAITETHRFVQLTRRPQTPITADSVNWLETPNHMNFVITNRPIHDGPKQSTNDSLVTVGMSIHRLLRKPFVVIETMHAPHLIENVIQHEAAHLVKVKNHGEYYDKKDHCNHPNCLMQPTSRQHLNDFCYECSEQFDERLYNLSKKQFNGVEMFRRIIKHIDSERSIHTVNPIDNTAHYFLPEHQ